jgi:hypothetical protein
MARGRSDGLCRRPLGLLVIVVVAVAAAALIVLSGSAAQHAAGARGLTSLPAAAQGPISAALGRGAPAYRVVGLRAGNPSQRLRVDFSRGGVAIVSGGARFHIALASYGYSSALQPLPFVAPVASANRVSYLHRSLREWYANGPLGVEQGIDVAARPRAASGPLTFSLALSGNLAAKLDRGSVLLTGRGVALRYGGLAAVDARGRGLHSWLELVSGHVLIRVDDRGAVYPLRVDPFVQQAELTAGDGAANGILGTSVAVSGDTIVVGAQNQNSGRGAVYVFVRPASGWVNATQTAELTATDSATGDEFGASVAVSGNTIVAGAQNHTVGANTSQGAAYVFVRPDAGWGTGVSTQTAELTASGGGEYDYFGHAVAVSGDTVVVGDPNHNAGYAEQGVAYVFVRPASGWAGLVSNATGVLLAGDAAAGDHFGRAVGVSGNTIVAGASFHKVGSNVQQGAAYVFVTPSAGWAGEHFQAAELTAPDGAALDYLGSTVAVSGDTVVAGASHHRVALNGLQGAAYVFVMPAGGWADEPPSAELTASDGAANDYLGGSVAVSGNTVIAGAYQANVGSHTEQGAAYVFVMPAAGWAGSLTQTDKLTAIDGAAGDLLGASVALSGNMVVAGAYNHNVGSNTHQGAAYTFLVPPVVTITSPASHATYSQGEAVATAYSCKAPPGATVTACAGPAAIDTKTLGSHTFTVNAQDSDGATATRHVDYTVALAVPIISAASQAARAWRENNTRPRISANKKKLPVGTTFSFALNEPATVTLSFTQQHAGRRAHGKCLAPSAKNRHKPLCTHTIIAGSVTFTGHPGTNKVRFAGRISRTKKLNAGRYILQITASNTQGKRSAPRSLTFTIVK